MIMELKEYIKKTIVRYLTEQKTLSESKAYPFDLKIIDKEFAGVRYKSFIYLFEVEGVKYECGIYPNLWQKNYYDVSFVTKGGSTKDRVGKDLNFMYSVLKTVAECMIDFLSKTDNVRIMAFEGDKIREKTYVKFFKSHPFFSKFQIDDTHKQSGFVEIHIK